MSVIPMNFKFLMLIFLILMKEKRTWWGWLASDLPFVLQTMVFVYIIILYLIMLSHVLQRIEVERKTNQLAEKEFESTIRQKQSELYGIEQSIKALNREKDIMAGDSENRVKLSLIKAELESHIKKHRKMQVDFFSHLVLCYMGFFYYSWISVISFVWN